MAVCAASEGYADFAPQLACYGHAGGPATPSESSHADSQVVNNASGAPQSPWNNFAAEPVQFDASGAVISSSADVGWNLQGGMPPMPYMGAGAWGNSGPMPQRPNASPNATTRMKRRFCTSFPDVQTCRRGSTCSFAHTREEIRAPLLTLDEEAQDPAAMTDDFFMYHYKTLWCPIGVQHEWHTCVYAHNYQDARRPLNIGYGARLCPYWSKKDTGAEYSQRCPLGLRCPYSHGAKEQLYHPQYFKTVICRDLRMKACPRQGLCAFFHNRNERRSAAPAIDDIDYSQPLPEDFMSMNADWIAEFLAPPFLPEAGKGNEDVQGEGHGMMSMQSYGGPQAQPNPYAMQQPFVFLLPYPMSEYPPNMSGTMGNQMCSPMVNQMNNPMANWVLVPVEGQQQQ